MTLKTYEIYELAQTVCLYAVLTECLYIKKKKSSLRNAKLFDTLIGIQNTEKIISNNKLNRNS